MAHVPIVLSLCALGSICKLPIVFFHSHASVVRIGFAKGCVRVIFLLQALRLC